MSAEVGGESPGSPNKKAARDDSGGGGGCCAGGFVAAVSSFSIQYNYAAASIAVAIMLSHNDDTDPSAEPDFPEPVWAKECLLGLVFVGSVVGMLVMGYLGDQIGVHRALVVSNSLVVVGALSSALLSWGAPVEIWGVIAASRFVLGAGVGGNYPLSAKKASMTSGGAAAAAQEPPIVTVQRTARAFFWQSPGGVTPYFVALALLRLPHKPGITSVQFRLLLALGALPAMVVSLASIREMRQMKAAHTTVEAPPPAGGLQSALTDARHWKSLIGTAGTWALFDVAYYGTVIFTPMILSQVFGPKQTLTSLSIRSALVGAVGILGVSTGIFLLPRLGAKALSTIGLAISGVLFLALMVLFQFRSGWSGALFGLLCALVFVLQAAPNVATFVLPVLAFPPEVRSTFHGLSSASAKVGAMVGSFVFPVINDHGGVAAVMGTQAAICFAAALLSHCCLKSDVDHLALCHDDEENSNLSETASGSSSVSSLVDESPE